ncbi:MAG TPA: peptidylprolyl isomerase [Vicinamibacterales bacterium]|nr:peptidylprolyl isomerase [Vicinamibacterales bacterium]
MRHPNSGAATALACVLFASSVATAIAVGQTRPAATPAASTAAPVIVCETAKGTFEIQTFAADAPKSVDHIVKLVRRSFYRGLRFHRVESGLVQIGDPQTRDVSLKNIWGTGTSGNPIGVAELSKKHSHVRGAVGLAHPDPGSATYADSQFYIMKIADPRLDARFVVIGQVSAAGMAVVDKLEVADVLKNATIK